MTEIISKFTELVNYLKMLLERGKVQTVLSVISATTTSLIQLKMNYSVRSCMIIIDNSSMDCVQQNCSA